MARLTLLAVRAMAVVRSIPPAAALAIHQFFWNP